MSNRNTFLKYWSIYGGLKAILVSPYFWMSVILTFSLFNSWKTIGWWQDVLAIIPGLLGFSLGGFAMWVAIGDDKFKSLIAGSDDGEPSAFMEINATFTHFIFIQVIAIIYALICKANVLPSDQYAILITEMGAWLKYISLFLYFTGYLLFVYALLTALATVFALLRISSMYDDMKTSELKKSLKIEENSQHPAKQKGN